MNTETYLQAYCHLFKETLIKLVTQRGQRASGRLQNSIRVLKISPTHFQVLGNSYFYFLIKGRKPTSPSKRGRLVKIMQRWITDKGLNLNPYAVAYKIDTKGIPVPNRFNDGQLFTQTIEAVRKDFDLKNRIASDFLKEVKTTSKYDN